MSSDVDWSQPAKKTAGKDDKKQDLIQEAGGINAIIAFGELIDNTLGNYEYNYLMGDNKDQKSLNITIDLKYKGDDKRMIYSENSGGIEYDRIDYFVSKTWSNWQGLDEPVGTWGKGQLVAFAYFGRSNEVRTNHYQEDGKWAFRFGCDDGFAEHDNVESRHPCDYYHPANQYWKVGVIPDVNSDLNPGETRFTFKRLTGDWFLDELETDGFQMKLHDDLKKYYMNQIRHLNNMANEKFGTNSEQYISISFTGDMNIPLFGPGAEEPNYDEPLDLMRSGNFAEVSKRMVRFSTLEPRWLKFSIKASELFTLSEIDDKDLMVNFETLVGLYDPLNNELKKGTLKGFMLWGNRRLFCEGYIPSVNDLGMMNNLKGTDIRDHRWIGLVKMSIKNGAYLPWMKPAKWGTQDSWTWKTKFDRMLRRLLEPYYDTCRNLLMKDTKTNGNVLFNLFNPNNTKYDGEEDVEKVTYKQKELSDKQTLVESILAETNKLNEIQHRNLLMNHISELNPIEPITPDKSTTETSFNQDTMKVSNSWGKYLVPVKNWDHLFFPGPDYIKAKQISNFLAVPSTPEPYEIHWKTLAWRQYPEAYSEPE